MWNYMSFRWLINWSDSCTLIAFLLLPWACSLNPVCERKAKVWRCKKKLRETSRRQSHLWHRTILSECLIMKYFFSVDFIPGWLSSRFLYRDYPLQADYTNQWFCLPQPFHQLSVIPFRASVLCSKQQMPKPYNTLQDMVKRF